MKSVEFTESRTRPVVKSKDPLSAWTISEADYPVFGEAWERLSFCLNYAILAPSGHNSQPWKFKLALDHIELYADRTRALPVVDPQDRELLMSCGAALFHLRLAIRYFGHEDDVQLFPDASESDLLAWIQTGRRRAATGDEQSMFLNITARRTNRLPFQVRPIPDPVLEALRQAAAAEGARLLTFSEQRSRQQVAEFIAEGDRVQMSHPSFRRELAAWIHPARAATRDGIPGYAHGLNRLLDFATPLFSLAVRTFDLGQNVAAHDLKLVEASPVLALLVTETDTPGAWLSGGEALARVLLTAAAHGLSASFLNQPIEVESLRGRLRETLGLGGFPQILLRLGYGTAVEPTPRRDVRELLI